MSVHPARLIVAASFAALMVMVLAASALGQTGTALRISPPNFDLEAEPGQVIAQQIRVSNRGETAIPITM